MHLSWADALPQSRKILPLPQLPEAELRSPNLVLFFDDVRNLLRDFHHMSEFCWFARAYPRCYRYHLEHAELRLREIASTYAELHRIYANHLQKEDTRLALEFCSRSVLLAKKVYWNFDAYLNALNAALDLLARCVGVAYAEPSGASFNRLCAKKDLAGPARVLRHAQVAWVQRMKDYRDCLIHYTPVDTILLIKLVRRNEGWEVRGKLPVNPNARDITRFRYRRRTELFRYSVGLWRRLRALDAAVTKELSAFHKRREFPKRTAHLFSMGQRSRSQ